MKIENFIINENASILDVIKKIQQNLNRAVLVMNRDKRVIGIISEGDILRSLILSKDIRSICKNIMKKSFYFQKKKNIKEARMIFKKKQISIIPILDDELKLREVITLEDII